MGFVKGELVKVVPDHSGHTVGLNGKEGRVISCEQGTTAVALFDDGAEYRYFYDDNLISLEPAVEANPPQELILDEAKRLVYGDRNNDYGHPADDYARNAGMFNALFKHKLKEDFTPHDLILFMILLKCSRLANDPSKRDSVVDIAGYAQCHERITKRMEGRE